jgi:hypothetical protein
MRKSGAEQWTGDLRLFYANDPLVLLAWPEPGS